MAKKTQAQRDRELLPELKATSREELEARKNGVLARGPSGAVYRVKQVSLQRHALSGGLPQKLRAMALKGAKGINQLFAADDTTMTEVGQATRDYLDQLVLAVLRSNEPKLTAEDLGSGAIDDDPLVPPNDYKWLLEIAMGEAEYDAEGRRLWGVEPLDRWVLFRHFHECAEDCQGCDGVRGALSATVE
jgi:hypothetical protein